MELSICNKGAEVETGAVNKVQEEVEDISTFKEGPETNSASKSMAE
jgi:hypothetical protein